MPIPNQLYLDITGRNDWSSALVYSDGTGNFSYFYPSVSGSWLASETFKESLPEWVSLLKLRGSWAQVGNDTSPFSINPGFNLTSIQSPNGMIQMQETHDTYVTRGLKPERKNAWEIGTDIRFFRDRVKLDFAYYKENTKDQILSVPVSYLSGVSKRTINAGNVQNAGIEIALGGVPFRNQDWEWNVNFTYTRNKSKLIELHPDIDKLNLAGELLGNYNVESSVKEGQPYGVLTSANVPKRDENGNLLLQWIDGERLGIYIPSGEETVIGKVQPDFMASAGTGLSWKGLTLNVLLDFRYGGHVASYANRYTMAYGLHENSIYGRDEQSGGIVWESNYLHQGNKVTYEDGIIPEGVFQPGTWATLPGSIATDKEPAKKNDISGMTYQQAVDAGFIEPTHASAFAFRNNKWQDGVINDNWFNEVKYIALREISLNYRLPRTITSKIGARGINLGFTGRDLGYLYNSLPNNLNPESVRGTAAGEFRIRGFYPNRASYTFSIGVDF